tara:strand:- start:12788 stop:13261 length:474 start_codon:yes stop_codon:yes gene_type:complete
MNNDNIIFKLVSFANYLDKIGLRSEADYVDLIIRTAGVDTDPDEDVDYEKINEKPPASEWNRNDYINALCEVSKSRDKEGRGLRRHRAKLQRLLDTNVDRMSEQVKRYHAIIRVLLKRERTHNSKIERLLASANEAFNLNINDIEEGCPEFSHFYKE